MKKVCRRPVSLMQAFHFNVYDREGNLFSVYLFDILIPLNITDFWSRISMDMQQKMERSRPGFGWWTRFQQWNPGSKAAFITAFVFGYIIHLYAFTNNIPNPDGLSRIYDTQQMTISGRWFLHFASYFHGFVQSPALIGFLSVLFLAVSAAVVAKILRLESPTTGVLAGLFMVSIPSVAYTYLYMFTASAYMFGVLLAVLAVYAAERGRFGWIFGAICLACAMGSYQAYLPVTASLALCVVIRITLEPDTSSRDTWKKAVSFLLTIVLGIILYYVILKIFLAAKDLSLISYKNINDASENLGEGGILSGIWSAYKDFIFYFTIVGTTSYITRSVVILNWILAAASLLILIARCREVSILKTPGKLVLIIVAFLLMPLAVNGMAVVSKQAPIMRYAFVSVYLLAIVGLSMSERKDNPSAVSGGIRWISVIASLLLVLCFVQTDNTAYLESETAHRSTERFLTELVTRVESMPGYQKDMEVAVVGTFPEDTYYSKVLAFNEVHHYSSPSSSVLMENKHIYYYLNDWLNVQWKEPDEQTMIEISNSEGFQSMPLYPSDGSVSIQDGRVIVRLSEQYIPKRDYEIEYENRR